MWVLGACLEEPLFFRPMSKLEAHRESATVAVG